ncbi:nitroreductase family protein [Deinococcus pimensis]|uniref:nitroreductase family protein n=1 Tax=Deinococcus pimensis TaxID=309888 RepID=UPI0004808E2D
MTPEEVRAFFDAHWTVRRFKEHRMPAEHLDVLLHAAQRAPTDATAQMYSVVRLVDPDLRREAAEATRNPHLATASEAFVVCADLRRLRVILEDAGYEFGDWPAAAVHFSVGDAVLAGQNLLLAAELLGYRGCWIGGVLSALPWLAGRLALPPGVFPYAGLAVGVPDEEPRSRPRLPRALVVHEDRYREPDALELREGVAAMAGITSRGDWASTLARYFARGGTMEAREPALRDLLARGGLLAPGGGDFEALVETANAAGFPDVVVRRRGERFEAWLDAVERAHRGEGASATEAVREAVREAVEGSLKSGRGPDA